MAQFTRGGRHPQVWTRPPPWPAVTEDDIAEVLRVLRRSHDDIAGLTSMAGGGVVAEFEEDLCNYFGSPYCVTTNSGGAALHAALMALEVGAGDEVIVTPYTWGQAVSCVLQQCAVPVFADIEPLTYTMDPASIERAISPYTKAIVVPHVYGQPADMPAIRAIADRHGVRIVEDCAQAAGAAIDGRLAGTFGDISCFSIGGFKQMTGGEGGFLLTGSRDLCEQLLLATQTPIRVGSELRDSPLRALSDTFIHSYRIHPLAAAICKRQLRSLDEWNDCRREQLRWLSHQLDGCPGVTPVHERDGFRHVYQLYSPTYRPEQLGGLPREAYVAALQAEGVDVMHARVSVAAHLAPRFQERRGFFGGGLPWSLAHREVSYRAGDCPVAEERCARGDLRLLLGANLYRPAREHLEQVAAAFWEVASDRASPTGMPVPLARP